MQPGGGPGISFGSKNSKNADVLKVFGDPPWSQDLAGFDKTWLRHWAIQADHALHDGGCKPELGYDLRAGFMKCDRVLYSLHNASDMECGILHGLVHTSEFQSGGKWQPAKYHRISSLTLWVREYDYQSWEQAKSVVDVVSIQTGDYLRVSSIWRADRRRGAQDTDWDCVAANLYYQYVRFVTWRIMRVNAGGTYEHVSGLSVLVCESTTK